jgi:hypothetical protein
MAEEIRLWQVGREDKPIELTKGALDLEERLQSWLEQDISILDKGLLVIGREVETDYHGFIDLLCIDIEGNLVVVELKRGKTPREVTAQVLDYASWVADLSNDRVVTIAQRYLKNSDLQDAFRKRFGEDLPETLNGEHRMLIVGTQIDGSSERIIRYLSDSHGVNINAAKFQYFTDSQGQEFVARVFLLEQSTVELQSRIKGTSKRKPNLTPEELSRLAEEFGVQELYEHGVAAFESILQRNTTRSSISFARVLDGRRSTVISLIPGESNHSEGLRYQIYKNRFRELTKLSEAETNQLMPEDRHDWVYSAGAGPDYEGYQGFIRSRSEIDRLAASIRDAGNT